MSQLYGEWYKNFSDIINQFGGDEMYDKFHMLQTKSNSTVSLNHKMMEKMIDLNWVEAIEKGLVHVDNVMRNPRKTVENVEEIVPIALSKKITVDSVKHLAQHTDLIQSVDPVTGKITPSKVLNVHKEESMMTYENKFVNTLIDRVYIFIARRYEKLKTVSRDEEVFVMDYNTSFGVSEGQKMNMSLRIETVDSLETRGENGQTMWERVEKLRRVIDSYKASPFCQQMGNNYIRPPVMRTNAITKNVDLKACLILWQFVESYDKAGYEITVSDAAQKPDERYIQDLCSLTVLNLMLFRSFTRENENGLETLKTKKGKATAPKVLKNLDSSVSDEYNSVTTPANSTASPLMQQLPDDSEDILAEIDKIIVTESEYIEEEKRRKLEAERLAEEKRRREEEEEKRRLEEERKKEEERLLALEKAERERREQEEWERLEALRIEQDEKERLEALRIEQEERKRIEDLRREQEEKERLEAEREEIQRIITEEAGSSSSENVTRKSENDSERQEREKREKERAEKLKAMRAELEKKSFEEIYADYSRMPVYVIRRNIKRMISLIRKDGTFIREGDTDQPMLPERIAAEAAAKKQRELDMVSAAQMKILYEKYSPNIFQKAKHFVKKITRKKKKVYVMPKEPPIQRTPQEQKEHDRQIRALFREYHVGIFTKIKRGVKALFKKSY